MEPEAITKDAPEANTNSANPSTPNLIHHAGRSVQSSELVEIKCATKKLDPRNMIIGSWFTLTNTACVGRSGRGLIVTYRMMDFTKQREAWGQRAQPRLQHLHGLLLGIKSNVPRDRVGAYVVRPLNPEAPLEQRTWELYEVEMSDPMVAARLHEFKDKFPSPGTQPS